jgi:hypothetical protein
LRNKKIFFKTICLAKGIVSAFKDVVRFLSNKCLEFFEIFTEGGAIKLCSFFAEQGVKHKVVHSMHHQDTAPYDAKRKVIVCLKSPL